MKRPYDLYERLVSFAQRIVVFVDALPSTKANKEYAPQVLRSGGSAPANYLEANEALGVRDRNYHLKVAWKEAKECGLWLLLIQPLPEHEAERAALMQEAKELVLILSAILNKLERSRQT